MISRTLGFLFIALSYTWTAAGSDTVLQAPVMAATFTRCAGLYDAAAMIQQFKKRNADAQVMAKYANGAETTAIALLMVSGTSKAQAKVMAREQRGLQTMYHIALLQAGNGDALINGFARCTNDYMPIQHAVLAALRAYAEQGKQDPALWSQMIINAIKGRSEEPGRPSP